MGGAPVTVARALPIVVVLALAGITMAGCGAVRQPTHEQARAETEAVLQRIASEVPGGVVKVDSLDPPYLACTDGGYYATIRWSVTAGSDFDGEAFVDALPGRLGEDFAVDDTVDVRSPGVALDYDEIALEVKVAETDRGAVVLLVGLTPCVEGDPPAA